MKKMNLAVLSAELLKDKEMEKVYGGSGCSGHCGTSDKVMSGKLIKALQKEVKIDAIKPVSTDSHPVLVDADCLKQLEK